MMLLDCDASQHINTEIIVLKKKNLYNKAYFFFFKSAYNDYSYAFVKIWRKTV